MKKVEINKLINIRNLQKIKEDYEKRCKEIDNCSHYIDNSLFNKDIDINNILSIFKYCPKCGALVKNIKDCKEVK